MQEEIDQWRAENQPRALSICACKVKAAFRLVKDLDPKKERLLWHPDKFSRCDEGSREAFNNMAKEIFVVVDAMRNGSRIRGTSASPRKRTMRLRATSTVHPVLKVFYGQCSPSQRPLLSYFSTMEGIPTM
ncbi:hypothetical protein CLAFUW4_05613 [Fulvia fulva]|uniref:Uncharacterized protein n=1 Tax=Passalora fulva TaxID=5499 RepID=A0A9Q8P9M5_PASFU|nr:uncharacterized protein CLAFUR5_05754 [Fulvia fulva]KAK4624383.1 hypothetical protein CLAFUR4_05608 [Fulvia fulva]KAK4625227.1 hypothetical protein CLAFUR0_05616 [Fulvia fulva]UJO18212.1 hypothetical protein CLAFUR5_05754 [Fulvia fulva]WPV14585.1 hypothetical protein CLAFUW4_05613 [Fulvia fulva]WPV30420.1 hypothetical protein CLAFUW7_05612 [Fulvia fulva]